ncbi:hypothetical protein N665_0073s0071 [Sinapis alba]|nr:hypothetical protein N665_0073s0071 [Sinapis alba]
MATNYPPCSRFLPTELGLVKLHLKNKVDNNISGFIKTLNVYGDVPWRLDHDMNPLYSRNEWYYFFQRTRRGVKNTVSRMVPRNGESLGGTWKSIGKKKDIKNKAEELMGYKRELVFNKNVHGETDQKKTEWHMYEYSLHKNGDEFHDWILCHIRLVNSAERFEPPVPAPHHQVDQNNNVLPNQEQQEADGFAMVDVNQQQKEQEDSPILLQEQQEVGFANHNDMMMMVQINQQQQQEEQEDSPILPHQIKDNLVDHGAEDYMNGYGLMQNFNNVNQQHEQQQDSLTPLLPPLQQSNDNQEHCPFKDISLDDMFDAHDDELIMQNYGQCISWDTLLVPPQVENNYNTVLPNQDQQEAGFANQHPPFQSNHNQKHCPLKDIAFYDMFDADEMIMQTPPLQRNLDNHGHECPLVPSQVENHNNNNNTVLPNQEQQESGFANQNDMTMMVEKEHGDGKQHHEQQQDQEQEQEQEDLLSLLLAPFQSNDNQEEQYPTWDDFGFDAGEDVMINMEEELLKLMLPVVKAQDSGVHADQVMPKD